MGFPFVFFWNNNKKIKFKYAKINSWMLNLNLNFILFQLLFTTKILILLYKSYIKRNFHFHVLNSLSTNPFHHFLSIYIWNHYTFKSQVTKKNFILL